MRPPGGMVPTLSERRARTRTLRMSFLGLGLSPLILVLSRPRAWAAPSRMRLSSLCKASWRAGSTFLLLAGPVNSTASRPLLPGGRNAVDRLLSEAAHGQQERPAAIGDLLALEPVQPFREPDSELDGISSACAGQTTSQDRHTQLHAVKTRDTTSSFAKKTSEVLLTISHLGRAGQDVPLAGPLR